MIEKVRKKFLGLRSSLTERARRLWAGAEADALGRGGVAWVATATGLAISTVRKGRDEYRRGETPELVRDRRPGGGRQRLEKKDPELVQALERLVNPTTRGDPESPLRWTCKSVRVLSRELRKSKHPVGPSKVAELLRDSGYSLQGTAKTREGVNHPDRDQQFEHINTLAKDFLARGVPVVSVDAKKKEAVGEHANSGREWQPKGKPVEVGVHEYFEVRDAPKAIPYGVYDVGRNAGFVNVGTDHNTPAFAVRSIEKWWEKLGSQHYPDSKELFITADSGGSNGSRSSVWKAHLQRVADRTGLTIHVSHFPPGTSKWNKIEHRLFSFITLNWRGRPLATYETMVALIGATTTSKGLLVSAELDADKYPLGMTVKPLLMRSLHLERAAFHGDWNYSLTPRTPEQKQRAEQAAHALSPTQQRQARWKKLVDEQIASGLSCAQFCAKRGISYEGFIRARRRLNGLLRPNTSKARRKHELLIKLRAISDE